MASNSATVYMPATVAYTTTTNNEAGAPCTAPYCPVCGSNTPATCQHTKAAYVWAPAMYSAPLPPATQVVATPHHSVTAMLAATEGRAAPGQYGKRLLAADASAAHYPAAPGTNKAPHATTCPCPQCKPTRMVSYAHGPVATLAQRNAYSLQATAGQAAELCAAGIKATYATRAQYARVLGAGNRPMRYPGAHVTNPWQVLGAYLRHYKGRAGLKAALLAAAARKACPKPILAGHGMVANPALTTALVQYLTFRYGTLPETSAWLLQQAGMAQAAGRTTYQHGMGPVFGG